MPVARIVTRNVAETSPSLQALTERLRAAGYEIELAQPGTGAAGADLLIELDQLPAPEALDGAVQLARESDADLFVAPGLFAKLEAAPSREIRGNAALSHPGPERSEPEGVDRAGETRSVIGETLGNLGAAVSDSRAGIRDSVSEVRDRVGGAWLQFQQRRAQAAQARRLERERRDIEREERRRQHQIELQSQAEHNQRMLAERERLAAERERVVREQIAREAALRAERERCQREEMARDAARRAEQAHAAEQERRRLAALESERLRVLREQEAQRAAALAAERIRLQREAEAQRPVVPAVEPPAPPSPPLVAEPVLDVAPVLKPRLVRPQRRIPSSRERQWQRAALVASLATLAAMIGFAIAANTHPASPLPASLMQNGAQQQVPFGPARMDVSSASKPTAQPKVAPPLPRPNSAKPGGGVSSPKAKPSAARAAPQRRASRSRSERDLIADDEVIVHHAPTSRAQRAQSTTGVRRYSDDN